MRAEREEVGERREDWREKPNFRVSGETSGDLDASACDLLSSFSRLSFFAESKSTSIWAWFSREKGQFGRIRALARRE